MTKGWRIAFILGYRPSGRYTTILKYANGVTIRIFNLGIHIWKPRQEQD